MKNCGVELNRLEVELKVLVWKTYASSAEPKPNL